MEFASGGELFDYIVSHQRVPERDGCRFFHQIMAGVDKVHELNVVHRDLKPENLLLDEHENIKIADFGLSNSHPEGGLLKTACGSPCYAAPEMIAGKYYIPSLCDVWSCGVILFAMICGYLPFEDQNTHELYQKILRGQYHTPDFLSMSARDLIAGILTTDPARRLRIGKVTDNVGMTIRSHTWMRQIKDDPCLPVVWKDTTPEDIDPDDPVSHVDAPNQGRSLPAGRVEGHDTRRHRSGYPCTARRARVSADGRGEERVRRQAQLRDDELPAPPAQEAAPRSPRRFSGRGPGDAPAARPAGAAAGVGAGGGAAR